MVNLAHAADLAFAASQQTGGGAPNFFGPLFLFGGMAVIFYFLLIRPQQRQRKAHAEMLAALKRGDRVATSGGLHGTITGLNERTVILRIADQVKVEVDRSAISRIVAGESEREAS
ncbi:MAG: preprotein translocase subunit YajC [Candidatus Methylomirabilia bacterium]